MLPSNALTIDVEDWFHILDSSIVPDMTQWSHLPSRVEGNVERMLLLLADTHTVGTFFWLGWMAQRFPRLVRRCRDAGHEIASHGYGHLLAYKVGPKIFQQDITRAKSVLENIIGAPVKGFRAPGFGIKKNNGWAFDIIKESGYEYDSSVFPGTREHGGIVDSPLEIHFIETQNGPLPEIPMSAVEIFGRRIHLFGGGYLRLASKSLIRWGIKKVHAQGRPLVVYIHPREIDLHQPRLPFGLQRRFKCYVNLKSTIVKLRWLCQHYSFSTMAEMAQRFVSQFSWAEAVNKKQFSLQGQTTGPETTSRIRSVVVQGTTTYSGTDRTGESSAGPDAKKPRKLKFVKLVSYSH
ncbi:MAG: XrtA system polysaccharide deacetylase [Planctomycetota bacterium]